jgi:uncharacterized protein YfbU (UPF0304 family)
LIAKKYQFKNVKPLGDPSGFLAHNITTCGIIYWALTPYNIVMLNERSLSFQILHQINGFDYEIEMKTSPHFRFIISVNEHYFSFQILHQITGFDDEIEMKASSHLRFTTTVNEHYFSFQILHQITGFDDEIEMRTPSHLQIHFQTQYNSKSEL